jgi:hypothetical protein
LDLRSDSAISGGFPYTAGENGGGAFILIYIACVVLIGLPVLMAEYGMGRKSGMSAVEGVESLARAESKSQSWGFVGWVGTITATFILSFYMVISAWLLAFVIQAMKNGFAGMDAAASGTNFANVIGQGEHALASKWYMLALLAAFIFANIAIVGRGVKGGIEKAASILMPAFFVILLVIVGFLPVARQCRGNLCLPVPAQMGGCRLQDLPRSGGAGLLLHRRRRRPDDHLWRVPRPRHEHPAFFRDHCRFGHIRGADRRLRDLPDRVRRRPRPGRWTEPLLRLDAGGVRQSRTRSAT